MDDAQTVTAEGEGVDHPTQPPFTGVEGVLPAVHGPGISVGNHHLADRGPEEDGTNTSLVLVADLVEDEALDRVHGHPQGPLLPADVVAVYGEARAFGLGDLDGFQILADGTRFGVVVATFRRDGHHPGVDDLEHLTARHVDEDHHPLDGVGIPVVIGRVAHIGQATTDPSPFFVGHAEGSCRPRVDLHGCKVLDAAHAHGGLPLDVLLYRHDGGEGLLEQQARSDAGDRGHGEHTRVELRDDLDHVGFGPRDEHESHATNDGLPRGPGTQLLPGRLEQSDVRETGFVGECRIGLHKGNGSGDLAGRQGGEGVLHLRRGHRYGHELPLSVRLRCVAGTQGLFAVVTVGAVHR